MHKTATSLDGTRIAYRTYGDGPRAIALIHGWMTSGAVFDELREAWQPERARLVVPDLRGAGDSEPARAGYALEHYRQDVLAVLDAERIERAVLVGHSMGGQLAQLLAASSPERVEVLVGVVPVPAGGLSLPDDARGFFRSAGGNAEALGRILDMASPQLAPALRQRLLSEALRADPRCVAETFEAWSAGGFADRLGTIAAPTLIVASDDPFLPVELLREQVAQPIRGARVVKLDGAGHYVPNEQPAALAAALEAFLAGFGDGASR